jgi:hypothetical protein
LPDFSCYNIPKREKYTKWPLKPRNTYTKWPKNTPTSSIARPSKIYPNCNFYYQNMPSDIRQKMSFNNQRFLYKLFVHTLEKAGWPDQFERKLPKIQPNPFFVQINA